MADALPVPNRKFLGAAFQDPATLLMVEQLFRQLGSVIPADITGLRNLEFVLTSADTTNAPNGHVVTPGANIGLAVASGLLTIRVTPAGTSGQIQYNNGGALGAFTTSGDATINTSTGVLTLATVNANVGTFGDSTHIPQFTVNAKGLITAASNIAITVPVGANPTAQVSGSAVNGSAVTFMRSDAAPALANTAVTPGSYTNANITVDAQGRLTSAASGSAGTVTTTGSPASGNLTKFSGASSITSGDLTGDVTTSGTLATTLASTAVTPGSYTSADITVDAKGRITAAANGSSGAGTVTHTSGALTSGQLIFGNGLADITVGNLSGDISTSGSGVTAIGTNKVTNAMIRQSGALAVVGRSANSTGNVADIQATAASNNILREKSSALQFDTLSSLMDDVFGSTVGGVIARGASVWGPVAASATAGQALCSNGSATLPSYQSVGAGAGGAMTLVSTQTVSGASTVDFTALAAGYNYIILGGQLSNSTASNFNVVVGTGAGPTWDTTAAHYNWFNQAPLDAINTTSGSDTKIVAYAGNATNSDATIEVRLITPDLSFKHWIEGTFSRGGARWGGSHLVTTTLTGIRLLWSAGTISGTFSLYKISR